MTKEIVALNGSSRKRGSTAAMLDAFLEGVAASGADVEVERVDLFGLDYKGCRGCLGCNSRAAKKVGCVQRDGASELLDRMREADGIVFASPIYFWEISAQLRAVLERYLYPGKLDHHQEVEAIYTMNQPEEVYERKFAVHMRDLQQFFVWFLGDVNVEEVSAHQTQPWVTGKAGRLNYDEGFISEREAVHDERWENDLAHAREAGAAFAGRL